MTVGQLQITMTVGTFKTFRKGSFGHRALSNSRQYFYGFDCLIASYFTDWTKKDDGGGSDISKSSGINVPVYNIIA